MSTPEENIDLANNFAKIFSTGDVAQILATLHPEASYWVSGGIDGMSGTYDREGLGALLGGVTSVYENGALEVTPTAAIAQGDKVAVEATSYAKLKNGKVYRNQYHFLFEFRDGTIFSVKEYMDTKHAYDIFYA
ncbi:nuclear transport factor 2 family protein [Rhodococcus koreensis]|uniref:nuclear transport factor 2 family protein n=1 Tax=Rhodococcus koreensis TaxID=99653 RepID=UPI003670DEF7